MSKIRFYKNGRDVTDDNKNQNYDGVSNIMDNYEIRNLASILDRLNKAEAENKRMEKVLVNTAYRNVDGASLERMIQKMVELGLISEKDTGIFKITDDVTEVVKAANKIGHPKISENFYDGFREASKLS